MRIFTLTLCFLLLPVTSTRAEWKRIESGTFSWLRTIQFVDSKTGWIAGSAGTLLKTEDGGITWVKQQSPTNDNIHDLFFQNADIGWLLCEKDNFREQVPSPTYILKTVDGGQTWDVLPIEPGPEKLVRLVGTSSRGLVLGIGETGTMLKQRGSESGQFLRRRLADKALLLGGAILASESIFLVGGTGSILRTEDDGRTWARVSVQGEQRTKLNSIFFIDSDRGWIVGAAGSAFRTQNAGKLWSKVSTGVEKSLNDVLFLNESSGLAVGDEGIVLFSSDGGDSWSRQDAGTGHRLEQLSRAQDSVFTVGFGGTILSNRVTQ